MQTDRKRWVFDCRRDYKRCELIRHTLKTETYLYVLEIGDGRIIWQVWDQDTRRYAGESEQEANRIYDVISGYAD